MFPVLVALIPAIFITRSKFFQENFSNKFGRFFSAYVLSYLAVQVLVLVISGTYIASMFAGVFFK
ncbi:MAG: hypothetical protein RBT34_03695, partial [Anaerolineaceae bacterium]|nr:hypothetical protein [Anaerolineaceae bacterium]